MTDVDKYALVIDDDGYFCEDKIADLLAEVERLRMLQNLYSDRLMKAYDWIAHWLGEENMRMFMETVGVTDEGDIPYMEIIKGGEEE